MRNVILAAAMLAATASPVAVRAAGPMEAGMVKRCKAEWPQDYSMRLFCIRQQTENGQQFIDLLKGEAASGDLYTILAVCYEKWGGDPRAAAEPADWPMVIFCYKQEREAWKIVRHVEGN